MPEISVNIEVYCARCGDGLCNQTDAGRTRGRQELMFRVSPCESCLEEARNKGYDEGYNKAQAEAEANPSA